MEDSTTKISFTVPPLACNSHLHIIDPAFPNDGKAKAQEGTVKSYIEISKKLDLPRAIFVQAKVFGKDNACLLEAIEKFGPGNCRGIGVVDNSISDKELSDLNEGGVKGLRFSVWNPKNAVVSFDDCFPLSERIKDMGWNVQLHMGSAQLLEHADVIRKIKCKIVIDHMGRLKPELGTKDPAYKFVCEMLDKGNTWVKLSGPYLNTLTGRPWNDATATAIQIAKFAPQRVVWGSDWPHVTEKVKPREDELLELLQTWIPDEGNRKLALVDNPAELYEF